MRQPMRQTTRPSARLPMRRCASQPTGPSTRRSAPPVTVRSVQVTGTTRNATRYHISTARKCQYRSQWSNAMMCQCKLVTKYQCKSLTRSVVQFLGSSAIVYPGNTVLMSQLRFLNRFLTKYLGRFVMEDMQEEEKEGLEVVMDLEVVLDTDLDFEIVLIK